jgi:hypothetical protein
MLRAGFRCFCMLWALVCQEKLLRYADAFIGSCGEHGQRFSFRITLDELECCTEYCGGFIPSLVVNIPE